ncbi:MAG TPA: hypothetical protein VLR54_06605, partial [Methanobacteriaceae archaeon]|nr:hypothetical protein [Methanobacteriaceae archaeon]
MKSITVEGLLTLDGPASSTMPISLFSCSKISSTDFLVYSPEIFALLVVMGNFWDIFRHKSLSG